MTDNNNNLIDISGTTITFFIRDVSGGYTTPTDLVDSDRNLEITPLDRCNEDYYRSVIESASVVNAILKLLESENDDLSPGKRYRNGGTTDLSMNSTRPKKKSRSKDLIKYLDNNVPKPPGLCCDDHHDEIAARADRENPFGDIPWSPGPSTDEEIIVREKIDITAEIGCLADLLQLIRDNPIAENVEYNINMAALHRIESDLLNLHSMVGMNALKDHVVDQIIYYLQGFDKMGSGGDFMHTVIYGPPGTGKTEVAKIIGAIFRKLGVLSKNKFVKATRADLIAGYLGQTALKTRDVVKDALGGVLFIDEAYALGNPEKRDSFAKECIDTLCEALSDHKNDLMVIVAGYEKELNESFFAYNQGLDSRFTWRFKTDDYKPAELMEIFRKKVKDAGWSVDLDALSEEWFARNIAYFKFFGRDMETLFAKVKIAHSRRVFCLPQDAKTMVTIADLDKGLALYLDNEEVKSRKPDDYFSRQVMHSMYT